MTNHYHLAFKTPDPNLVEGMQWRQNTWTKRFNARHGMWGHVYGGRYKAVLAAENEHLSCLIDYVHLNPFRAGMVNLEDGIEQYGWSSLRDYLSPPRKRSGWVQVTRGLEQKAIRSKSLKWPVPVKQSIALPTHHAVLEFGWAIELYFLWALQDPIFEDVVVPRTGRSGGAAEQFKRFGGGR